MMRSMFRGHEMSISPRRFAWPTNWWASCFFYIFVLRCRSNGDPYCGVSSCSSSSPFSFCAGSTATLLLNSSQTKSSSSSCSVSRARLSFSAIHSSSFILSPSWSVGFVSLNLKKYYVHEPPPPDTKTRFAPSQPHSKFTR